MNMRCINASDMWGGNYTDPKGITAVTLLMCLERSRRLMLAVSVFNLIGCSRLPILPKWPFSGRSKKAERVPTGARSFFCGESDVNDELSEASVSHASDS